MLIEIRNLSVLPKISSSLSNLKSVNLRFGWRIGPSEDMLEYSILKSAIKNYDKINSKKYDKYLLIGDMLELGSHSKKLHQSIAPIINQTKIKKVFVKGKMASLIFKNISKAKRGRILFDKLEIIELIKKDLNNNDYLMIKASLATGFNNIVKDLKGLN